MSDNSDSLQLLQDAKTQVQKQVDSFGASPVFGFTKWKFFIGVSKSYLTIYILGRWPEHFWMWNTCQFWVLFPVHVYRWWKMKHLLYFTEFCWVVSMSTANLLPLCHFRPDLIKKETSQMLCRTLFAFASGPLAIAVPLFGNAMPLATTYNLRWHHKETDALSMGGLVTFWDFFRPVAQCLGGYHLFHCIFFVSCGLNLSKRGMRSSPGDQLMPKRSSPFIPILGRMGSGGSDVLRYLKYELLMFTSVGSISALTYFLYNANRTVNYGFLVSVFLSSVWNGAGWYAYNLQQLTKGLDDMIAEREGKEHKKSN